MKKYIVGICFSMLFFTSCSDWLNVEPKTTVKEEEVFSRELGFKEALTGAYIKMASTGLYARNLSYGFLDVLGGRYNQGTNQKDYYTFAPDPSSLVESYCESIWSNMYNIIANLNNLLYYCDKNKSVFTTPDYYEIIKGEALGLRAFLHFDLLRMYGPIYKENPGAKRIAYRTEFTKDAQSMQSSNVVVDSIIADLKKAEVLLTNTDPLRFDFPITTSEESNMEGDRFLVYRHKRMNLYAVKAMLARVYLYAGNQELAAKYANEVNDSDLFELLSNANDVMRSKEIIFSVYIDKFDQQVENMMTTTSYIVDNSVFNEIFDVANDGLNDFRVREGVSFENTPSGKRMLKYKQENVWPSLQNTVVLIRLSEMYYILAECAETPEEASNFLNSVREVRGIDPVSCTSQTVQSEIEKEYRIEFYGEGQVFFYYKRLGRPTFVNCPLQNLIESNYMFSWPENEILFGYTN